MFYFADGIIERNFYLNLTVCSNIFAKGIVITGLLGFARDEIGSVLIGFGTFLNFFVICSNDFLMPVSASSMARVGIKSLPEGYAVITEETKLSFLADVIPAFDGIASIGDVFILAGFIAILFKCNLIIFKDSTKKRSYEYERFLKQRGLI